MKGVDTRQGRRRWWAATALGGAVALGSPVTSSCGSPPLELCGQIPDGGCPIGRGGTCDDATCAGLYDCVSGTWQRVKVCTGGSGTTTSASSGAGGSGGGGCVPVTIDRSLEVAGCKSNLQTPDCPAAAAESCTACEGCDDFFLCELDTSMAPYVPYWAHVAFCDPSGKVVLTTP